MINGYELDPSTIDFVHACYNGDHGKRKFHFAAKVVLRMTDGKYYNGVFSLANVKCKKDNAQVLDKTCMPELVRGKNFINCSHLTFAKENDGTMSFYPMEQFPSNSNGNKDIIKPITPTVYIAGDLVFLAIMMVKADFTSSWCN